MNIPEPIAYWLSFRFEIMLEDRLSVVHFADGPIHGYEYGMPSRRELVVDLLYRCIKSGLVVFSSPTYLYKAGFTSLEEYCSALVRKELESNGGEITAQMLLWLEPEVETTPIGDALYLEVFGASRLDAPSHGLKPALVGEFSRRICQIFAENRMPWTGELIFSASP